MLHAINGGWSINGGHESKVVLCMLGLFAEEERDLVSLRTEEALAARHRLLPKQQQWIEPGLIMGISRSFPIYIELNKPARIILY